jgi:hypothetical protein
VVSSEREPSKYCCHGIYARSNIFGSVKASLERTLPCEANSSWRAARIVLAIVFLVAITIPLAGQEPSATQRPGRQGSSRQGHGMQGHGTEDYGTQGHGTQGTQGSGTQGNGTQMDTGGGGGRGLSAAHLNIIIFGTPVAISVVAFMVHLLKKKIDPRPPPKIEIVSVKDYGEQHVAPGPAALALELCAVLDPGDQALAKVGPLREQRGG